METTYVAYLEEMLKKFDEKIRGTRYSWVLLQKGEHSENIMAMGKTMQDAFDDYLYHDSHIADREGVLIELLEKRLNLCLATRKLQKEIDFEGGDIPWYELGTYNGFLVLGTEEEYEDLEGPIEI